jgi:gluconokinase
MVQYVIMGVSGCGKSSIGQALAVRIGATFIDGDDLHPASNVAKMARGEPLDDADRAPWLEAVALTLSRHHGDVIIGCSALRRRYRDWIRAGTVQPVLFIHLAGEHAVIAARMTTRSGHFMPPSLLDSQFAALEPPSDDEASVTVDINAPAEQIVADILCALDG